MICCYNTMSMKSVFIGMNTVAKRVLERVRVCISAVFQTSPLRLPPVPFIVIPSR